MEQAELAPALRAAVDALEKLGIEYYLFGGNAHNVWGSPRYTDDGDLIIALGDERFPELFAELRAQGFKVDPERHLFRLRTSRVARVPFNRLLVDFVIGETEFEASAMKRRRRVTYLDTRMWVASAEDVILHKLIAHRSIDLPDIESIIRRQRATLDRRYLRRWAKWLADQTGFTPIETTLREMLRIYGRKRVK